MQYLHYKTETIEIDKMETIAINHIKHRINTEYELIYSSIV